MPQDHEVDILTEFVIEAREHLASLEAGFLRMERTSGDDCGQEIAQAFRAIHSIKGAAGFLRLTKINDLSHVMESLLQAMRASEVVPGAENIDPLLAGVDLLGTMLDDVANSNAVSISDLHERISAHLPERANAAKPSSLQNGEADDAGDNAPATSSDFDIAPEDVVGLPPTHENFYILHYMRDDDGAFAGRGPTDLLRYLEKTGTVIASREGTGERSSYHDVLYATVLEPDLIAIATDLSEGLIRAIEHPAMSMNAEAETGVVTDTAEPDAEAEDAPTSGPQPSLEATETIRLNVDILDDLMGLAGELVLVRNQHLMNADNADPVSRGITQRLDVVTSDLQEAIMRTRMQPIGNVFGKLPRLVRDLSRRLAKQIDITLVGNEVELDKTIIESLADPLTHLIRNACDHGIETAEMRSAVNKPPTGHIGVRAYHEGGQINLTITDDGRGIDPAKVRARALKNGLYSDADLKKMTDKDVYQLIMLPGFSTAEEVSDVSGRGVGMDVVRSAIERLGGALDLSSQPGAGTTVHLRLPLTLAIIPCLVVTIGEHRYAIPQVNLEELVRLYDDEVRTRVECAGDQEVYRLRDRLLPMVRMSEVLAHPDPFTSTTRAKITEQYKQEQLECIGQGQSRVFAVVKSGDRHMGLIVDEVLGTEEIVVKPMHPALKKLTIYSGATVMGDGCVALILDVDGIARHAGVEFRTHLEEEDHHQEATQAVLLFKSGPKEHFGAMLDKTRRIEEIDTSAIEQVGDREFITIDETPVRILRLESLLNVSPCTKRERMFLLLPKESDKPVGILISELADVASVPQKLDQKSYAEDGLAGTAVVQGHMTLLLDFQRILTMADEALCSKATSP